MRLGGAPPGRKPISEQYSLAKILGIWALAAAPMGVLGWIVFPLLAPDSESDPLEFGVTRLMLLTLGLVWLFVLSMIIVRREEGDLRWATIKRRLRLNQEEAPAQYPARTSDRRTPRKALVVGGAFPRRGRAGGTCTGPSPRKRFGVGLPVSCGTPRLQL